MKIIKCTHCHNILFKCSKGKCTVCRKESKGYVVETDDAPAAVRPPQKTFHVKKVLLPVLWPDRFLNLMSHPHFIEEYKAIEEYTADDYHMNVLAKRIKDELEDLVDDGDKIRKPVFVHRTVQNTYFVVMLDGDDYIIYHITREEDKL